MRQDKSKVKPITSQLATELKILLLHKGEMSIGEIADELGLRKNSVKSFLSRVTKVVPIYETEDCKIGILQENNYVR